MKKRGVHSEVPRRVIINLTNNDPHVRSVAYFRRRSLAAAIPTRPMTANNHVDGSGIP